jgi:hypothetical protein
MHVQGPWDDYDTTGASVWGAQVGDDEEVGVWFRGTPGARPTLDIEVVCTDPGIEKDTDTTSRRAHRRNAWWALTGRYPWSVLNIVGAEQADILMRHLEQSVWTWFGPEALPTEPALFDGNEPYVASVPLATCTDRCVVVVTAWPPSDESGWIRVVFQSNATAAWMSKWRNRMKAAWWVWHQDYSWTRWDTLTNTREFASVLWRATTVAFGMTGYGLAGAEYQCDPWPGPPTAEASQ